MVTRNIDLSDPYGLQGVEEKMDPLVGDHKTVKKRPPTWREMHVDTSPKRVLDLLLRAFEEVE